MRGRYLATAASVSATCLAMTACGTITAKHAATGASGMSSTSPVAVPQAAGPTFPSGTVCGELTSIYGPLKKALKAAAADDPLVPQNVVQEVVGYAQKISGMDMAIFADEGGNSSPPPTAYALYTTLEYASIVATQTAFSSSSSTGQENAASALGYLDQGLKDCDTLRAQGQTLLAGSPGQAAVPATASAPPTSTSVTPSDMLAPPPAEQAGFSPARAVWEQAWNVASAVMGEYFLRAATDLQATGDPNYNTAIHDLKNLGSIPNTGATLAQQAEAHADVMALNRFFNTPGLPE